MEEANNLNTVKKLIEYLQQFPKNTKVFISDWDCYNDEPSKRSIDHPYTIETKGGKLKEIRL